MAWVPGTTSSSTLDLRAEIERRFAEIRDQLAGRVVASARVTTASIRVDLANYRGEVQRQGAEVTALRERLSEALGSSYVSGLPEADRMGLLAAEMLRIGSPSLNKKRSSFVSSLSCGWRNWRPCGTSTASSWRS